MRFFKVIQNLYSYRLVRVAGLLVLLSVTVLTALWQETSASSDPVPEVAIPHRTAAPAATPTATPAPTPVLVAARPAAPKPAPAANIVPDPASLTVVVNKQRSLPTTYVPAGLVVPNVPLRYSATLEQSHLRADAAAAMEQLFAGASASGYQLALVSGYRSAAYQTTVYNNAVHSYGAAAADQGVARPGHSEHQTGLGADIGTASGSCDIDACFGTTPEGEWVRAHATDYGFIIRYPSGKDALTGYEYEPWHIRYVGSDVARAIQQSGQILEEYFGLPYAPGY